MARRNQPANQVRIQDANGRWQKFEIALDRNQQPQWTMHRLPPVHITLYQNSEEARYAGTMLGSGVSATGSVYAQDDLSGGMGKKIGVRKEDAQSDRYYYMEWLDGSVKGQTQKGPKVTTLSSPANSGTITGFFTLSSTPYLVLGRIIASWASDSLTQAHDFGSGATPGAGATTYFVLGSPSTAASQGTTGSTWQLTSSDARVAQEFFPTGISGVACFLNAVQVKMSRAGLSTPSTPVITTTGTAGTTAYSYKVTALQGTDETAASSAGSTATGNATLSSTNYNNVTWQQVANATGYKVYRTASSGTPSSTGLVGTTISTTFSDTGIPGDGSAAPSTDGTGKVPGEVRCQIVSDYNAAPGVTVLAEATLLAENVSTSETQYTFTFDSADTVILDPATPYFLVIDAAGAAPGFTINVYYNAAGGYANGSMFTSTDAGNSWTNQATPDLYFTVLGKAPGTTSFIGVNSASTALVTTTDGGVYTSDAGAHKALDLTVVGSRLIRALMRNDSQAATGLIDYTDDGVNWSGDLIAVGDPSVPITRLIPLGDALVVTKEDGIYAVDILNSTIDVQQLYASNRAVLNGQGSCYWRSAAYIPFNGRLMAVEGDFSNGFTVHESIGIEALPEWDWPWGQGRHAACVGTRFHLYSVVSTSGGYRLLKSSNPLRKNSDGTADPEWHGSLATIGDGSQTVVYMAHYDPGGSGSPQLFVTTTSNNVARIQLPRSFNPASDAAYSYDISTTADLYFPYASAGYPVHPKEWLAETTTFNKATAGDYIEMVFDTLDGEGWRAIPGVRLYNTGALAYPSTASARLLARRLRLTNTAATASPLLMAFAAQWAARPIDNAQLREITFSVIAEDDLSSAELGEMLGLGAQSQLSLLDTAAIDSYSRKLEDPYGNVYERVVFLDAQVQLSQFGRDNSGGRSVVQISAIAVGA